MEKDKNKKAPEELSDEALDHVAGGFDDDDEVFQVGGILCSYCRQFKPFVDTYYGPSGTLYLCRECYEKHHKDLGV